MIEEIHRRYARAMLRVALRELTHLNDVGAIQLIESSLKELTYNKD